MCIVSGDGVVTHTHPHTHTHTHTTCDNLPREIYDNLQQDYRRHVWSIDIVDQPTCQVKKHSLRENGASKIFFPWKKM